MQREVARRAADWFLRWREAGLDQAERADLERWRAAHPDHERAWQRALRLAETFERIPSDVGMRTLDRRQRLDRRGALKHLAVLIGLAPAAYLAARALPWSEWSASYRTGIGERRELVLDDGSRVMLNTDSALDVLFDNEQRLLQLHAGEILVTSGDDGSPLPQRHRPLRVRTSEGMIEALGTRFLVRRGSAAPTRVAVFEGAVAIRPGDALASASPRVLHAGEQARFSHEAITPTTTAWPQLAAWTEGRLVADNMLLSRFLKELARYRHGLVRCDDRAGALRISGTFQLDHSDRILAALPATVPVDVAFLTPYWVTVRAR
ncbi:Fe2+-dicitrate sensor, membrane protein [Alcanivorax xiamenensis]|uniref:Fe2+-dicitrate sensor, membrane protein n=1 Tax=Alcanivorax xiamenensis TaxID=1177156 RepID=A0ABQ6Y8T6_9GAMM|nr:Fe2+-dicitrate sensor, membrane protein [Alcanivorax xiamenensis]